MCRQKVKIILRGLQWPQGVRRSGQIKLPELIAPIGVILQPDV
jgi:hypothetical protein